MKDMLGVWKILGSTERDLLDLQGLVVWTVNPGLRILRTTTTHVCEYGGKGRVTSTTARRRDTEGEGIQVSVVHISVPATPNVIRPAGHGTFSEMGTRN
jgi:hypothetical protein